MRILAGIVQGLGILLILAAGLALAFLLELDFLGGDYLPVILISIFGGIVVGVGLIAGSTILAPGSAKVSFPLFRSSRSIAVTDPTPEPEDKP